MKFLLFGVFSLSLQSAVLRERPYIPDENHRLPTLHLRQAQHEKKPQVQLKAEVQKVKKQRPGKH